MFKSKLFLRTFLVIVFVVTLFSISIYFLSVPLIKQKVYDIEERSGKTILNVVHKLAERTHLDIETHRESILAIHKRELKTVLLLVESQIKDAYDQFKKGLITEKEAKRRVIEAIKKYRYGNNDYIFLVNYDSIAISHPDPIQVGRDMSKIKDVYGNFLVPNMIEAALKNEEGGFTRYWWQKLGEKEPSEKLSYSKSFPPWKWIIGSGVYIDDIKIETVKRKERAIEELRKTLKDVKIAKTGYVYIFDSNFNMVIHPSRNIEHTNVASLLDPLTKKPLAKELIKVADTNKGLRYKWDKPKDPGNYSYEKISWVRYFK
ncbi:MAG: cache domain-containing protein, partial [Candidatus Poribacteria bacterium]